MHLRQPYSTFSKIGAYCDGKGINYAIGGSWALLFWGVCLPSAPRDLDLMLDVDSLDDFYMDNPWISRRDSEVESRAYVIDDAYPVDLWITSNEFQKQCLGRAVPFQLGGMHTRLLTPTDILLFKLGRVDYDSNGAATCHAIVDWKYATKPTWTKPETTISTACDEVKWVGPIKVDKDG